MSSKLNQDFYKKQQMLISPLKNICLGLFHKNYGLESNLAKNQSQSPILTKERQEEAGLLF